MTRLTYAFFLLLGVAVAGVMLMPGMEGQLKKVQERAGHSAGHMKCPHDVGGGGSWS